MATPGTNFSRVLALLLLLAAAGGCATLDPIQGERFAEDSQVRDCAEWYGALDSVVSAAGVRDAHGAPVAGFPYLRVDRFAASLAAEARKSAAALHALVDMMLALDQQARSHEIANLSAASLNALWQDRGEPDASAAVRETRECGRRLRDFDLERPGAGEALLSRLTVPDDYVTGYRVAGLYALSRIPFSAGVRKHLAQTRAAFARDLAATAQGDVVRYSPRSRPRLSRAAVLEILERAAANPLRVPDPSDDDLDALFALYAPSFEVETTGDHDRPGALRWRWGALPEVEAADLAVYRHAAYTRYRGVNLLQLVYTMWFPERPAQSSTDLLAGPLDGVVFRVTLSPAGTPLVYDTIHPCGCYHMFFTTPRAVPAPAPDDEPEWAHVPQSLGNIAHEDRLVVRVASRTHYVERVYADRTDSLARYDLRPYDDLRSLPLMPGGQRSIFGPDGIVPGTERGERFLFWPMGIANAGAMRQWGRQATAFVGRRHFDDADLFEKRFVLELK